MADIQLSQHFMLSELCKSEAAIRHGIDNTPTDSDIVGNLRFLCANVLEPVRAHFNQPFRPNSGYRSPTLNSIIGGSKTSQHTMGEAVDIELPTVDNHALASWIRDNLKFDQLILEMYRSGQPASGWVHCSLRRKGKNRGEVLTTADGRKFLTGLRK